MVRYIENTRGHPNVAKAITYRTKSDPYFIIYEPANEGSLKGYMKKSTLDTQQQFSVCRQVNCLQTYPSIHTIYLGS